MNIITLTGQEYDILANPDRTAQLPMGVLEQLLYEYCMNKYSLHKTYRKEASVRPMRKCMYVADLLKVNASTFDIRCQSLTASVLARI